MSWSEVKKINSDLNVPLNEYINTKTTEINTRVGQAADTANPTGSVHAKLNALRPVYATETLRFSADTERTVTNTSFVKVKAILIGVSGIVRVKFDQQSWGYTEHSGRVYKNGLGVGTLRTSSQGWTTFSEDFAVSAGDAIELWGKGTTSSGGLILRNFRIYFDFITVLGSVALN